MSTTYYDIEKRKILDARRQRNEPEFEEAKLRGRNQFQKYGNIEQAIEAALTYYQENHD